MCTYIHICAFLGASVEGLRRAEAEIRRWPLAEIYGQGVERNVFPDPSTYPKMTTLEKVVS